MTAAIRLDSLAWSTIARTRKRLVCLDVGGDQLTAVEISEGMVTTWISRPVPAGIVRGGDPQDSAALGAMIGHALSLAGVTARRTRIALPDAVTVSRTITLPPMPQRDLARAMRFAAEKHVPFPIGRACWSWDVLSRSRAGVRVYLVAAWRDVVERYADAARTAGLDVELIEPRSLAVARALDRDEALLIETSGDRLQLTLLVGGQPVFFDDALLGGDDEEQRDTLDRLLQRAFRYQSSATSGARRLAPVLLAGQLEDADLQLPVPTDAVGGVLNGQLPEAPPRFRPGSYLANLGLALRSPR